jgi:hypothetical protein
MSSRQERELAMRTKMIVALATVVQAARVFVDAQAELCRDDIAGDKLGELETLLKRLLRNSWARAILDDIANGPAAPPTQDPS